MATVAKQHVCYFIANLNFNPIDTKNLSLRIEAIESAKQWREENRICVLACSSSALFDKPIFVAPLSSTSIRHSSVRGYGPERPRG